MGGTHLASDLFHHLVLGDWLQPFAAQAGPAERAAFVVALLVLWWGAVRWCGRRITRWFAQRRLQSDRRRYAIWVAKALVWIVSAQLLFAVLDVPSLVVTIGGGLALVLMGLAGSFGPLLSDFAAGLLLRSDGDLHPGMRVRFRSIQGEVTSVEVRKIKLRDAQGRTHVIPSRLLDQEIFVLEPGASGRLLPRSSDRRNGHCTRR